MLALRAGRASSPGQRVADKQLGDAAGQVPPIRADFEPAVIWRYSRLQCSNRDKKEPGGHMETITTAPQTTTARPFTVRPLSPALGAEIMGVDLRDPIDEALKQTFLDTWHQYLVILLRGQTLDEDAQVRFA